VLGCGQLIQRRFFLVALSFSSSNVLLHFLLSFLLVRLLPVGGLEDALDVFLFEAVDVVGLDDFVDSDEGLLEGVERRRVDHLLLDLGRVRAPTHQEQFRPVGGLGSLGLLDVVVVVDGVAAVVVLAVLDLDVVLELLPVAIAGRGLVEADLSVGDLEDGVPVRLVLLDALVRLLAVLGQLHA